MEPIHFKFRFLNAGQETGFFSSKGTLTEDELVLGKTVLPLSSIYQVVRRDNRLVVLYATDQGTATVAFAQHQGLERKLKETIDRICSYRWAERRHEELARVGRAAAFRTAKCRACTAVVDLTGFAETPQFYCPFCEGLQRSDQEVDLSLEAYRLCDKCRFYCRPAQCTTVYIVFNFYSWRQINSCHVCIRSECWKMLIINLLPPFIGVLYGLAQAIRAYTAGSLDAHLPELVRANALAHRGRVEEALTLYEEMLQRTGAQAGLRYNLALGYARALDWEGCLEAALAALEDCSNYQPAANVVVEALTKLDRTQELEHFRTAWGAPTVSATPALPAASDQIQSGPLPRRDGETGIREA